MRGILAGFIASALLLTGCVNPVGADKASPRLVCRQVQGNAINSGRASQQTKLVLARFGQQDIFLKTPDLALQTIHHEAVRSHDHALLFALSELNYLAGERLRHNVKPWETRDPRDYYLAATLYAWFFLFGESSDPPPGLFDARFQAACDLYNISLGWALTANGGTNGTVRLAGGDRRLPVGNIAIDFEPVSFPWNVDEFDRFVLADHFLVRGLSIRNGQSGLGTPLAAVTRPIGKTGVARAIPGTLLLRPETKLEDMTTAGRAKLELYSTFEELSVKVGSNSVPLRTDTTMPLAYVLNQSLVWDLGWLQFFSSQERIPCDTYMTEPYQPGKIPVVFVHGTFSSPVWWAEMFNTLISDPEIRKRCQFWYFNYNSGNPMVYSAVKFRESLEAKLQALDPEGRDEALRQAVLIGHSQGGLLARFATTDTGDQLLQMVLKTNRVEDLDMSEEQEAFLRKYTCFSPLPFVKRAVFICTPHRGSYLASNFVRNLAQFTVKLPSKLIKETKQLAGVVKKIDIPEELKGSRTSLDGMSMHNPLLLRLADMPLAPGIKGHSIIAVRGKGDFHHGKDGLVAYDSAHLAGVDSEFIVRSFHSCQGKPPVIEEVRRILREHLAALPPARKETPNTAPDSK